MENNRPTIESKSTDRRKRRISLLNDRKTQTKRGNLSTPLSDTTTSSLNRIDSSLSKNIQTGKSNPTKNPNISNETGQAKLAKAKATKVLSEKENKSPCTNYTPIGTKRTIDYVGTTTTATKNKSRAAKCNIEPIPEPLSQTTPFTLSTHITNIGDVNSRSQYHCTNPTESQLQNLNSNLQRSNANVRKYVPGLNLLNKFSATLPPHKPTPSPKVGSKRSSEECNIAANINPNKRKTANHVSPQPSFMNAAQPSLTSHTQTSLLSPNTTPSAKIKPTANASHRQIITSPLQAAPFDITPATLKNQFYFSPNELLRSQSHSTHSNQTHLPNHHSRLHHSKPDVGESVPAQSLLNKFESTLPTHTHSAFSHNFGTIRTTVQYENAANINVNMRTTHHSPSLNIPSVPHKFVRVPLPAHSIDPQPSQVNVNSPSYAQTPASSKTTQSSSTTRKSIATDADYFHTMSDRVPPGNTDHVRVSANYDSDVESDNSDQHLSDSSSDDDIDITAEIHGLGIYISNKISN